MRSYDETFERVMAGRDSYMRRKKERRKAGLTALAVIVIVAASVTGIKYRQRIKTEPAGVFTQAAIETDNTSPETADQKAANDVYTEESGPTYEETTAPDSTAGQEQRIISGENTETQAVPQTADEADCLTTTRANTVENETAPEKVYIYHISEGKYENYVPGKVIDEDQVGEKIGAVTVTGGWKVFGKINSRETLSADVYYIKGVSDDVAVCVKFNDKSYALTTTHYYVLINPDADATPVRDYDIGNVSAYAEKTEYYENEYGTFVVNYTSDYTIPE